MLGAVLAVMLSLEFRCHLHRQATRAQQQMLGANREGGKSGLNGAGTSWQRAGGRVEHLLEEPTLLHTNRQHVSQRPKESEELARERV